MREWGWLLAPEQRERAQAQAAPAAPAQQLPSIPQVGGPVCGWCRWVALMGGGAALLFKARLVLCRVFGAPVACPPSTQLAKPSPVSLCSLCDALQELVNIQAYILWEQAGKPDGADFGDRARQVGGGAGIDGAVAGHSCWRGQWRYGCRMQRSGAAPTVCRATPLLKAELETCPSAHLPTPAHHPTPGCPQALEQRLRSGATIADIEQEFRAPQPPPQQQQQAPAAPPKKAAAKAPAAPPAAAPAPPPPPPSVTPVVGQSMGMRQRNPLDLIRRSDGSGQLMSSKPKYLRTPLASLLEQAQAEKDAGRLVWYRVSASGAAGRLWFGPGRSAGHVHKRKLLMPFAAHSSAHHQSAAHPPGCSCTTWVTSASCW